eukprot:935968-Pelagomonas_calceolata.AAC.5
MCEPSLIFQGRCQGSGLAYVLLCKTGKEEQAALCRSRCQQLFQAVKPVDAFSSFCAPPLLRPLFIAATQCAHQHVPQHFWLEARLPHGAHVRVQTHAHAQATGWDADGCNGSSVLLQNAVEKMLWAGAVFTSDSEHVVALASSKTQHHLYIWNRVNGKMERILEGVGE